MIVPHVSMNAVARTMVHGTRNADGVLLRRVLRPEELDGVIGGCPDYRHQHEGGASAAAASIRWTLP